MIKRIFLAVLFTAILAVWVLPIAAQPADQIIWGQSDGTCQVGTKSFPAMATAGDLIRGVIVIRNTGKVPITVALSPPEPIAQIGVDATIDDGGKVEATSYTRPNHDAMRLLLLRILPSKSFEIPIRLTRLIDMSRRGYYDITFTFRLPVATTQPSTKPSMGFASSSKIKIHVTEPEKWGA